MKNRTLKFNNSFRKSAKNKQGKNHLADEFLYICILIIASFCVYDIFLKGFL